MAKQSCSLWVRLNNCQCTFNISVFAFHFFTDQRNLGMSMRIERSSLDQVKKRFDLNKKKKEEKRKEYDFDERLRELKEEVSWSVYGWC